VAGITPNTTNLQGSQFAINGARPDNTNFIIDGFSARDPLFGGPVSSPNLDSMQEFKMQTNSFSAEYGRMAGGVMNMVLKSGTNDLHGALFEFLRNDALDTRNFFDTRKSELRLNQFGGLLGGPIWIPKIYNGQNRTFFFMSWESLREVQGSPALGVVATVAQRSGDFSAGAPIADPLSTGTCPRAGGIGACFPGNVVPTSRLSSAALAAQEYYPLPNTFGVNNMSSYAVAPTHWDSFVFKFDEHITDNQIASFRYTVRFNSSYLPYNNPTTPGSNNTGLFGAYGSSTLSIFGFNHTFAIAPTIVNEIRLGLTRTNQDNTAALQGTDYNAKFGIPGLTTDPALIGFPLINISGYQQLGPPNNYPLIYKINSWPLGDTFTWVKGSHVIKAGLDVLHTQTISPYPNNARGSFTFTGYWTGQPYADFLLGYLNGDTRQVSSTVNHVLATSYGSFVQDDWKPNASLTLNLGLRWEVNRPAIDSAGRWSNFVPGFNKVVIASLASLNGTGIGFTDPSLVTTAAAAGVPDSLVFTNYKVFLPRLGFAYRPWRGNRTVIRGGYGIFDGGNIQNGVRTALGTGYPFTLTQNGTRNATNPLLLTFTNPFPPPALTNNIASFALSGYELHPPTPYLQSWNFTVEREIGFASALKISYVGSKGTHFGMQDNINQPYDRSAALPGGIVPYPLWSTISYFNFQAKSIYHGGTVTWQRRFVNNFFFTLNYTYSKSIDDASTFNSNSTGGISGLQNVRCLDCDRGRSDWDIGHIFTASYSWEAKSRYRLLRGWQLAGTSRLGTGNPFTPVVTNTNLTLGQAIRPNRIGAGTLPNPTVSDWFNVADFPQVPNGSFLFGNAGRNIVDGPGNISINTALSRNFTLFERTRLQVRWEVFNVLNRANFQLPQNAVNAPNAGTITAANPSRQMQFGLRYSF
jgi:hypothetical protein